MPEKISFEDWREKRGTADQYIQVLIESGLMPAAARNIKPRPNQSALAFVKYLVDVQKIDMPKLVTVYKLLVADRVIADPEQSRNAEAFSFFADEPPATQDGNWMLDLLNEEDKLDDEDEDDLDFDAMEAELAGKTVVLPTASTTSAPIIAEESSQPTTAPIGEKRKRDGSDRRRSQSAENSNPHRGRNLRIAFVVILLLFGCGAVAWFGVIGPYFAQFYGVTDEVVEQGGYSQWNESRATQTAGAPATQTSEAARDATAIFVGTQQTSLTLTPAATIEQSQNLPTIAPTLCVTQTGEGSVTLGCSSSDRPTPFPSPTLQPLG